MLVINDLCKSYPGGIKAVDHLSLKVNAGDIFGFIGHNGAGKSTTIKTIVGVLDFEAGEILIHGHSIKDEPMLCKQDIAYIPDTPDLYEHMTGIQFLNFVSDIFIIPASVRQKKIYEYAEEFELTNDLGNLISSYSHGMKQKLALIAAVIHDPKLLVLDEPFVGLDPKASASLKRIMHRLCEKECAIFFSTHVLDVAEKLCDKVAMIHQGQLVFSGTMNELLREKTGESLEEIYLDIILKNDKSVK